MKFALYARVSTVDKNQDPELQLKDLRTYATARCWQIYDEYVDIGQSGSKTSRPELDRLIEDAKKRKIDGILVWRLDRFGRSLKHLVNTLDDLGSIGVTFVSYHENIDVTTPSGKLFFHMIAAIAEFEKDLIRDRVKAGLANAKAKGIVLGRPGAPFKIEKITKLRSQGLSIRDIAEATNKSKSFVHKTLKKIESEMLVEPEGQILKKGRSKRPV
jgi:putative DNA-invertase from lambdoid prophage Rac